jgi:hypothetical protein
MQNRLTAIFFIVFISIPFYSSGQKLINSPLARFNLGMLEPAGSFRSIGMGGTGVAYRENSSIYFSNPASYSSLDTNSFVFDFGLDYGFNILKDDSSKYFSDDLNFDHLLMGFPITRRWGVALGIIPLSNGYYNISQTVPEDDSGTGEYIEYHGGNGSLTNFFVGSGINVTKNLSVGANLNFLFGTLKRFSEFDFTQDLNVYNLNMTEKIQLTGIGVDLGVQYSAALKNNYFLNAGASWSSGKNCKSKYESIAFRFNYYGMSDTLPGYPVLDDSTRAHLPGTLRLGASFGKKNKFTTGIDFIYTNWSNAKFYGSDGYLADTKALLIGAEYIPDKFSNYSFLKRIEYRIGGHIEDNYLILNGKQVKEFGASIGFGIPLRRTLSKTNFFFDYTKKSYKGGETVLYENYFTMGISLNLYDRWFVKRKYD